MNNRKALWSWMVLPAIIVMVLVSTGSAAAVKLPKTGQATCTDNSGNAVTCTNTGQDGDLQKGVAWPNPRFTPNASTAITDNLTGLVWAPNGNLLHARDPQWEKRSAAIDGAMTWQHALDYVAKLNAENYLGHNDWRLPNLAELESLLNRAQPDTAQWLNSQGFTNAQAADYYWSSTTNVNEAGTAWAVDMGYGNLHYFKKTNSHYVWPVRAGQ